MTFINYFNIYNRYFGVIGNSFMINISVLIVIN